MLISECQLQQRVKAKPDTLMYERGCREGDIYHVGEGLVCVEFDYLGYVAAVNPDDIEPV